MPRSRAQIRKEPDDQDQHYGLRSQNEKLSHSVTWLEGQDGHGLGLAQAPWTYASSTQAATWSRQKTFDTGADVTSSQQVAIQQSGRYQLLVEGHQARGSFQRDWQVSSAHAAPETTRLWSAWAIPARSRCIGRTERTLREPDDRSVCDLLQGFRKRDSFGMPLYPGTSQVVHKGQKGITLATRLVVVHGNPNL
jgi:hypothetical protein